MTYGRQAQAPCGHSGEHIFGNYVKCLAGCDDARGAPKPVEVNKGDDMWEIVRLPADLSSKLLDAIYPTFQTAPPPAPLSRGTHYSFVINAQLLPQGLVSTVTPIIDPINKVPIAGLTVAHHEIQGIGNSFDTLTYIIKNAAGTHYSRQMGFRGRHLLLLDTMTLTVEAFL